ncbi:MAG TPA: hypothetical protein VGP80_02670 [Gemmatimonadales bacterium]|nr:hypothetical protein [Gemmatimonadales bacterium]
MTRLMLFLHFLGFSFWLGGSFAMMMVSIVARKEDRGVLRTVARIQAMIARGVVGPGAAIAVVTGLILTFRNYVPETPPSMWLMVMQGTGILAGLLTFVLALPAVAQLTRIDPMGEHAAYFDRLRQRARMVGMASSLLAVLALVAGAMLR